MQIETDWRAQLEQLLPRPKSTVQSRARGKWLEFQEREFVDPVANQQHRWEFVRRTGHTEDPEGRGLPDAVDAVEIVTFVKQKGKPDSVLLVVQYRPPLASFCVEFPAGLLDPNETPETAARRELLEETGYNITKLLKISPSLVYEPGLSNSNMKMVLAEVDLDVETNHQPQPQLESSEWSLKTLLVPLNDLSKSLEEMQTKFDLAVDAKLYTFAYAHYMKIE